MLSATLQQYAVWQKSRRPQIWWRLDVRDEDVALMMAWRTDLRARMTALGHRLAPFHPSYHFDGQQTRQLSSDTHCVDCRGRVSFSLDLLDRERSCYLAEGDLFARCPAR
jgi:hypothetical protein